MKLLAHTEPDFGSPIVTIFDAIKIEYLSSEPCRKIYYDIIRLWPMIPVLRGGKKSSFAFLSSAESGHGFGSKGIAHELVQEHICKLQEWNIKVFGKNFNLRIESTEDEWYVNDFQNMKSYYVDCLLNLAPDSDLYSESGGQIGIEVSDSHPIGHAKRKALNRAGLLVLELNTIEDWHVPNERKITSDDLKHLRARISGFLNKGSRLSCLSKPENVRI